MLRRISDMTQVKFGAQFNMARPTIAAIESDKRQVTLSEAIAFAEYFGLSVDEMCTMDPSYIRPGRSNA
jgi:DNA-binding XRE family transcriptional regulator